MSSWRRISLRTAARVAETAMQTFSDQAGVLEEVAEETHSLYG